MDSRRRKERSARSALWASLWTGEFMTTKMPPGRRTRLTSPSATSNEAA